MFALRQWWSRYALRASLLTLALMSAWGIHQLNAAPIYELYRWVTLPLQPGPSRSEVLEGSSIQELRQKVIELEIQNRTLRETVAAAPTATPKGVPAAVIGRSAGDWWQQLVLSRGSNDGINIGDIVAGPGGLVGRIIAVSSSSSRVLLISDSTSRVGARVSRSRATGYVRGQAGQQVIMEFFDKMPEVEVGDTIVTSAYSQLFPEGMAIGRVVELDLSKSPAPEVTLELSAPLNILEWVEVIPFVPPQTAPFAPETPAETLDLPETETP
ncbi:MAG: rod shape-determining protein MreC [Cyanobacteria bacterium]|nr:rod shape-determining protein MreC [Cyanobacteriota bacterium]MDA0864962.1 rod shape-determining protein MreC [Cyanobacteriota bacterium]